MKKWIPLGLALMSLVIFLALIFKNEQHLKNSQSIYIRLLPVDPRSLIQGDYMVLNYQFYFAPQTVSPENNTALQQQNHIYSGDHFDALIKNKSSLLSYVQLDQQMRVIHTYFDLPKGVQTHPLILQNPNNRYLSLYPASRSFLFAEGLAQCYQQAQYAEFKVDQQGNAILTALKGQDLQDLGCDAKRNWFEHFNAQETSASN